ncbi:MAG: hypothetical protein SGBAC_002222 [Bacillariaceae sp.]
MPRKSARLSNTYVPLPVKKAGVVPPDNNTTTDQTSSQIIRKDRNHEQLRPLCLETSILSQPTTNTTDDDHHDSTPGQSGKKYKCLGSSLVELGHTKVLCEVNAVPTAVIVDQDKSSLQCQVQFAKHMGKNAILERLYMVSPLDNSNNNSNNASNNTADSFSIGKLQNATTQLEAELAQELTTALQPALVLAALPKCAISVQATILQDDGSVLSTCIAAATLALMDAQVEMTDLVTSCTVAVLVLPGSSSSSSSSSHEEEEYIFLADPTQEEMIQAQAIIVLAMTPNHKEVTLWRQSGRLTSDMANQAIELCRSGCRTMHKFMREVWVVSSSLQP